MVELVLCLDTVWTVITVVVVVVLELIIVRLGVQYRTPCRRIILHLSTTQMAR